MENSNHTFFFYKFLIIKVLQLTSKVQLLAHDQLRTAAISLQEGAKQNQNQTQNKTTPNKQTIKKKPHKHTHTKNSHKKPQTTTNHNTNQTKNQHHHKHHHHKPLKITLILFQVTLFNSVLIPLIYSKPVPSVRTPAHQ